MLIQFLIILMTIDYITGLLTAIRLKKVSSEVMFWGGIRKGIVIVVVAIAAMCDNLLGMEPPVLRALAIYFYMGREGISILENIANLGVPLPAFIRNIFEQIKDRGGEEEKRGEDTNDKDDHMDGK